MKRLYAPIEKVEQQADGTLKVWGYASTPDEDSDGETITPEAMKAALPEYLKFGAVREMHQAKAAGTAIEAEVQEDGRTWFGAHVVDSEAVKKVRAKVYKGFSVGGKISARDEVHKSTITGIQLVEVSLVDRPANPEAVFTMYKADGIKEPQAQAATEGDGDVDPEKAAIHKIVKMIEDGDMKPSEILAKATVGAAGAQDNAAPEADMTAKDMYSVASLAQLIAALDCLQQDAAREAAAEGDNSPIPDQLKAAVDNLQQILSDMAAEETEEAQVTQDTQQTDGQRANNDAPAGVDDVERAAQTGNLEKDENRDLAALPESLEKMEKLRADNEALAKRADELTKRVSELEAMPKPGKAILKAVSKSDDIETPEPQITPVRKADGSIDEVSTALKKIHATGGKPFAFS